MAALASCQEYYPWVIEAITWDGICKLYIDGKFKLSGIIPMGSKGNYFRWNLSRESKIYIGGCQRLKILASKPERCLKLDSTHYTLEINTDDKIR